MTTTDTPQDRKFEPNPTPHIFGVDMTLDGLKGGVEYDGVFCQFQYFNDLTGAYDVTFSVPCPACEHYKLSGTYRSTTDLSVAEIGSRLLETGPCQDCQNATNGAIAAHKKKLADIDARVKQLEVILTSPRGVAPTVTHSGNRYGFGGGDFFHNSVDRVPLLCPTWLQQNDPDTVLALKELYLKLRQFGRDHSGNHRWDIYLTQVKLTGFIGIVISLPCDWDHYVDRIRKDLKRLKEHRRRMRKVAKAKQKQTKKSS